MIKILITFILSEGKEASLQQQMTDVLAGRHNYEYIKIQDVSFFEYFMKEEGYDLNKDSSLYSDNERMLFELRNAENESTKIVARTFMKWGTYIEHIYDGTNLLLPTSTSIFLVDKNGNRIRSFPKLKKPLLLSKQMIQSDQIRKWESKINFFKLAEISYDCVNKYRNQTKVEVIFTYYSNWVKVVIKPDITVSICHYGDKKLEEAIHDFVKNHSFIQKQQNVYAYEREVGSEREEHRIRDALAWYFRSITK